MGFFCSKYFWINNFLSIYSSQLNQFVTKENAKAKRATLKD